MGFWYRKNNTENKYKYLTVFLLHKTGWKRFVLTVAPGGKFLFFPNMFPRKKIMNANQIVSLNKTDF